MYHCYPTLRYADREANSPRRNPALGHRPGYRRSEGASGANSRPVDGFRAVYSTRRSPAALSSTMHPTTAEDHREGSAKSGFRTVEKIVITSRRH